jgi:type IV fimbrial biogenesis protein FimT
MDVTSFTSRGRHYVCHGKILLPGFGHSAGFTLLELLSAITIILIIFGIGIPVLKATVTRNRLTTSINALAGTLAYSRSEAIRRNQQVVVCKSTTGTECTRQGDWRVGWLVYVDMNQNRSLDGVETILGSHRLAEKIQVDYRAFGSRHYLTYRPSGTTRTNGTFTFCDPAYPEAARSLIITKTGRARLSNVQADGSPLACDEI